MTIIAADKVNEQPILFSDILLSVESETICKNSPILRLPTQQDLELLKSSLTKPVDVAQKMIVASKNLVLAAAGAARPGQIILKEVRDRALEKPDFCEKDLLEILSDPENWQIKDMTTVIVGWIGGRSFYWTSTIPRILDFKTRAIAGTGQNYYLEQTGNSKIFASMPTSERALQFAIKLLGDEIFSVANLRAGFGGGLQVAIGDDQSFTIEPSSITCVSFVCKEITSGIYKNIKMLPIILKSFHKDNHFIVQADWANGDGSREFVNVVARPPGIYKKRIFPRESTLTSNYAATYIISECLDGSIRSWSSVTKMASAQQPWKIEEMGDPASDECTINLIKLEEAIELAPYI